MMWGLINRVAVSASLLAIATALIFYAYILYLKPSYLLSEYSQEYANLVGDCAKAMVSVAELDDRRIEIDDEHMLRIYDAIRIELISCHEAEKLKQFLLSYRVNSSSLAYIELDAKGRENLPLGNLVDQYTQ